MYVAFAVLCGFRLLAPPTLIDQFYGQGLYPVAQGVLSGLFGWWPFSANVLGIALLLAWAAWGLIGVLRASGARWRRTTRGALLVLHVVVLLGAWFLLTWGMNYGRPTVPQRLGLSEAIAVSADDATPKKRTLQSTDLLVEELRASTRVVNGLRASLTSAGTRRRSAFEPADARPLGRLLQQTLVDIGTDTVPVRRLRILPAGTLLRFGTAGVFSPWTGDPHVDGGLHALQMPFTATHELAHAQGVTEEGDCNLLAYLACRRSPDPFVAYSAELTYLRYLRSAVARRDRALFDEISAALDPAVDQDLRDIRFAMDRFREIAPQARDLIYDSYLKTQGVQEGLASYGRIIDWVVAVKRERPEFFREAPAAGRAPRQ